MIKTKNQLHTHILILWPVARNNDLGKRYSKDDLINKYSL